MRSSGLWCDVCVVYFKCIKEESGGFRVKFVKVCEWFHAYNRLKNIFKSRKNRITKLPFILKIIKNYHYIILICRRKNIKMYKWK